MAARAFRPTWRVDFCRDGFCLQLRRRYHPLRLAVILVCCRCQLLAIEDRPGVAEFASLSDFVCSCDVGAIPSGSQ
ncbi:MAG: hypothetical protein AAB214_21305 [Fibrobacterota bacterium]